jgi:hypothetical protein
VLDPDQHGNLLHLLLGWHLARRAIATNALLNFSAVEHSAVAYCRGGTVHLLHDCALRRRNQSNQLAA